MFRFKRITNCLLAALDWISHNLCISAAGIGQPIPWDWVVRSDDPAQGGCASGILGTYAVVNLCTSLLGLFFGHRKILSRMSAGKLGKPGSTAWRYSWIFTLLIHFAANAVIAAIIKTTPGYGSGFQIWQLMLFLTTRPRIGWILGVLLARTGDGHPWASFGMSQFVAESILTLPAAYFMGQTVGFAVKQGFYSPSLDQTWPQNDPNPMIMYGGALWWLISAAILLPLLVWTSWAAITDLSKDMIRRMQLLTLAIIPTLWLAQWLFSAGYFTTAGPL
jgi:hypothetical protein